MNWHVSTAKNGEETLKLNNVAIYSSYCPKEDAKRWIDAEINSTAASYLLIGLGLGYHLLALHSLVGEKPITVFCFDMEEKKIFESNYSERWWKKFNINIVFTLDSMNLTKDTQLLLPNVWIKALGEQHKLFGFLETIKIYQQSYKKFSPLLLENFKQNTKNMGEFNYPTKVNETACLIASGPSLDESICDLKKLISTVDVYAVGSALKPLLQHNINPKAVVISDAQDDIIKQFEETGYTGELYYLSTANFKAVKEHKGDAFIMFQQGFECAENMANELNYPLLETGGSVSTVTYSLIEFLGYKKVLLFGLDLGVTKTHTHAKHSTSGKFIETDLQLKVIANDGTMIYTMPNLRVYLRWFEKSLKKLL